MSSNQEYWKKRFEIMNTAQFDKSDEYVAEMIISFDKSMARIQSQINAWYQRFADNNSMSLADAKKLLNSKELREFKWTVEDYIKAGIENGVDQRWMKELENASARVHISRLETLKIQMQQEVELMYQKHLDATNNLLGDIYQNGYYHTAFEVEKGIGVGFAVSAIPSEQVEALLKKPWTTDARTFSDRIWANKTELIAKVQSGLVQNLITGDHPLKLIKEVEKQFGVKKAAAARLVMTESAFFASTSQQNCYRDLGVSEYQIVATLDNRTSEICQELDGRVFKMTDYAVGSTAPPFHVHCRTVTAPYFEDEDGSRIASSHGKTYFVPASMTYKEWATEYLKKAK